MVRCEDLLPFQGSSGLRAQKERWMGREPYFHTPEISNNTCVVFNSYQTLLPLAFLTTCSEGRVDDHMPTVTGQNTSGVLSDLLKAMRFTFGVGPACGIVGETGPHSLPRTSSMSVFKSHFHSEGPRESRSVHPGDRLTGLCQSARRP